MYGELPTPKRDGYTFLGWYDGTKKITESTTVTRTTMHTLTAHWIETPIPPTIAIRNYVEKRDIDYRTTITFIAEPANLPSDSRIVWVVTTESGETVYKTGDREIINDAREDFTILVRAELGNPSDGYTVAAVSPPEHVHVKRGFFDRLKAFFRNLFHRLPDITQEYLGIEKCE